MKAAVYDEYGPPEVVKIKDVKKPIPKDNEVLIKIHATTVSAGDHRVRSWDLPSKVFEIPGRLFFGITGPRRHILGTELAGEIEEVGKNVKHFKEGDQVYALSGARMGGHAEYVCLPESAPIFIKPTNLTYEEAASIPFGALSALHFLRDLGKIKSGKKILINGASGAVGSYAVQLAKVFGAEVTAVCSTKNVKLVKSLGADFVIDYTKEDITKLNNTYDIILDTVGRITFAKIKHLLKANGRFLETVFTFTEMRQMLWTSVVGQKKVIGGSSTGSTTDLGFLKDLIESERIKPVIDRKYPLAEIVEAHRYVDEGHKTGSVVITVQ